MFPLFWVGQSVVYVWRFASVPVVRYKLQGIDVCVCVWDESSDIVVTYSGARWV